MEWIKLAQDKNQLRVAVKSYVHQAFMGTENFLTSLASIIFPRRSALSGVAYCIFPSNYFITRFVYLANINDKLITVF
jgi:hypothetical protein